MHARGRVFAGDGSMRRWYRTFVDKRLCIRIEAREEGARHSLDTCLLGLDTPLLGASSAVTRQVAGRGDRATGGLVLMVLPTVLSVPRRRHTRYGRT